MLIFSVCRGNIGVFLFLQKGIFPFYPFLKMTYPQLADKYSFPGRWFQNQFNFIDIAGSQADNGPDTDDIIFINPVKFTRVKHFIDIP